MINKLEIVVKKNKLDILDFSLKDNEILLYLKRSNNVDNIKLIQEFEMNFSFVMLKEHSSEKILITLGDKNE